MLRNLALWMFHIIVARPVLRWLVGLRYRRKNLVPDGPCLVVSNHNSHLDAAILMTLFPLRRLPHVHPVAAADYFGKTWLKRTMALLLMNGMPIERHPPKGSDPLQSIVRALSDGETLIFFPEGSRGEAGVVSQFRPGIGRLVHQLPDLQVLPVFLSGPERIWARGQVVPVPLNIDAIVGKPRTYSPDLDPRLIADQVRKDVLALAPPPRPAPEAPPRPPARIAVCGVDSVDRHTIFRRVIERVAGLGRTLGVSDPVLEGDADGVREMKRRVPLRGGRTWLRLLAGGFRTRGRFKGEKFVEMVERAQLDEILGRQRGARFVVSEGSALVDLMAWAEADFYRGVFDESGLNHMMQYLAGQKKIPAGNWWKFVRNAPEVWLINTFNLTRPPVPDVIVLVRGPISQMTERLRAADQQPQPYDNEEFLSELQVAYGQVGAVLSKRRKVTLFEIDLSREDPARLIDRVAEACARLAPEFEPQEVES